MAKTNLPANELIAEDYRKHHVSLLRFTASERKEVLAELKKMQKAALAKLAESDLTEFRRTKIEALLRQINPIIEDTYKALASRDMTELAEIEEAFARKTVGPLLPSAVGKYNALTKRQIQNICSDALIEGAPSSEWWKRQSEQFKQFFSDTVRQGMMEGQGISEIARKIRSDKRAQQRAELLVRSSVMEVANKTREESFRANDDVVKGFQHVSTFDSRTTVICAARDGLTWDLDGNPIGHDKVFRRPPLHFGCRSTLVPVLRSWREMGLPFDEIPESTRASMDGQVPAKMNMDDWLKSKGDSFGEELLGKTRYHLWKDGKITLSQLTDQAGRELTVEELRKVAGVEKKAYAPFVPAKTVKEAEEWVVAQGIAENAKYGGLSLEVANECNQSVYEHFRRFPELKKFDFVGSTQDHYTFIYNRRLEDYLKKLRKANPGVEESRLLSYAKRKIKKKKVTSNAYAISVSTDGVRGISINRAWGARSSMDRFRNSVQRDVASGFHPKGCGTIRAIVDHEMGHQLDSFVNLSEDLEIKNLYASLGKKGDIGNELSMYAKKNLNEFIAEAWCEYTNSAAPRPVAMKIGKRIEELYAQKTGVAK
jgi:SPP1 gp7 family putative phage head morphogenesis protein